ncbi:MAG: protein-tyrosine-phosphatase [Candidatus Velthaea sp.]|jgi:predicted protein tyrosine phosphatase
MDEARPHHICGIEELHAAPLDTARRVISILDPNAALPRELANLRADLLVLRFDDVIVAGGDYRAPERDDIERLLAFDRGHLDGDTLVLHCTAGISRSTAAFAILAAQRQPGAEADAFAQLRAIRARAWPNSLMIALADDILDLRGRLVSELREHYKMQLRRYPEVGRMMIGLGREREIPFDRLIPNPPRHGETS